MTRHQRRSICQISTSLPPRLAATWTAGRLDHVHGRRIDALQGIEAILGLNGVWLCGS